MLEREAPAPLQSPACQKTASTPHRTGRGWWLPALLAISLITGILTWAAHDAARALPSGFTRQDLAALSQATNSRVTASQLGPVHNVTINGSTRRQVKIRGLGLAELAAGTSDVLEFIWSDRLTGTGVHVAAQQAADLAAQFARGHVSNFATLTARPAELIEHGSFSEYRVTFQRRIGQAWLPEQIVVAVNAASGETAYFWRDASATTVDVNPDVTRKEAVSIAKANVRPDVMLGSASLMVVHTTGGGQELVWSMVASPPVGRGLQVMQQTVLWIDAHSGRLHVAARAA